MKKHCISDELIIVSNAKDNRGDNAKIYASLQECWNFFKSKHKTRRA